MFLDNWRRERKTMIQKSAYCYVYFDSIQHEVLTRKEETALIRKIEKAFWARRYLNNSRKKSPQRIALLKRQVKEGKEARHQLITHNLKLVVSIALRFAQTYNCPSLELEDLINEGNQALVELIDRTGDPHQSHFRWQLGCKFSTFACYFISWRLRRFIDEEIKILKKLRKKQKDIISLEACKNNRGEVELLDLREPNPTQQAEEREENNRQISILRQALAELEQEGYREDIELLKRRFGINGYNKTETLKAIGCSWGKTKERVRQIEKRALKRLRQKYYSILYRC